MADLDSILQPENLDDDKPKRKKTPKSNPERDKIKSRLNDLKEQLKADPVRLDTNELTPAVGDFPEPPMAKYIDYDVERKNHKEFAIQVINNIVGTYIHSEKLLNSPRLKDLKQDDQEKYTRILLMLGISEGNLLKLQESIDGGDMSKEMFDSVNKAQQELRANIKAKDEHLKKCDVYWNEYAERFGLENEEEKIVQESTEQDVESKRVIVDMSNLTNLIHDKMDEKKKDDMIAKDKDKKDQAEKKKKEEN